MTTKTLSYCALLAALQVAMARLFGLMPSEFTRFSIEAVPTVIAGILFGPVAGGLVGFTADLVGCLFSGYGYNPIFCIPPILYGVFGGLFRPMLAKRMDLWRILLTLLPPVVLGSVLWQSFALGFVSGKGFLFFFATRSIQFAITIVVDALIIHLLFKTKVFRHMGVWPPEK
ncbi:MAG: folate family ECF transporter S component [Oscillospiraceae bacterium]|nr:folate family ECF transporter S component [Oscillospiraceae bacterium]